ncbi:MAG: phosphodiesterase, partial [Deltaproteobacteria bacterium]
MLIVQISDTHIAAPGKKTYGIAPMAENLARCVDHINQMTPTPDVV